MTRVTVMFAEYIYATFRRVGISRLRLELRALLVTTFDVSVLFYLFYLSLFALFGLFYFRFVSFRFVLFVYIFFGVFWPSLLLCNFSLVECCVFAEPPWTSLGHRCFSPPPVTRLPSLRILVNIDNTVVSAPLLGESIPLLDWVVIYTDLRVFDYDASTLPLWLRAGINSTLRSIDRGRKRIEGMNPLISFHTEGTTPATMAEGKTSHGFGWKVKAG